MVAKPAVMPVLTDPACTPTAVVCPPAYASTRVVPADTLVTRPPVLTVATAGSAVPNATGMSVMGFRFRSSGDAITVAVSPIVVEIMRIPGSVLISASTWTTFPLAQSWLEHTGRRPLNRA